MQEQRPRHKPTGYLLSHKHDFPVRFSSPPLSAFQAIAELPQCIANLLQQATPHLSAILSQPEQQPEGLVAGAMELLTMLLKVQCCEIRSDVLCIIILCLVCLNP